MTTVDTYAVCPCGNGKKIKFCRCKDSVGELDSVLKMVEGGQMVPALDRLSSILQENPDAAWAFAIRGRLLLDLREYETLSENAERFIRLQPSNPLALTQRAAAMLFKGDAEQATVTLLEALTESGRNVDSFVLDVASVLAFSLAQSGAFLTARVYATLSMMASGYEGGQTAVSVLRQLNQAPTISLLMKSIPETISRPADVSWGERFDEASSLLQSNQVILAESKLQSLRKTAAQEPSILSGLLTCAIWRGDVETQSDMLKKLAECEAIDEEQRARYLAMSALAIPGAPDLAVATYALSADLSGADVSGADESVMAMMADARFVPLPPEMLGEMRTSEEEVPPKAGFQIIDRDKPESTEGIPPADQIPESIGMAFVYGKQTDREARVQVLEVKASDLDEVKNRVEDAVGGIQLTKEDSDALPMLVAGQPAIAMIRFQAKPNEAEKIQREIVETRMPTNIAKLPLGLLGGSSLTDLASDETKKLERTAVMRAIEQYDALYSKLGDGIDEVYSLAGLQKPATTTPSDDEIETIANEDLIRVDPSKLTTESLIYLVQRSQQISSTISMKRFATALLDSEMTEDQQPAKLLAYMCLINTTEDKEKAIAMLEEAKAFADSKDISTANLLLTEVGLRLSTGDGPGFQQAIQTLSTKHGNEPEIMAQLQQLLMSYGLIGPDGKPRQAGGPPPAAAGGPAGAPPASSGGGGLWTPDSGSPAAAPQSPSSAGGGESGGGKIWMPGMD